MPFLVSDKVVVPEKKIKDLLIPKGFGDKAETQYVLDLYEANYLCEKDKIQIEYKNEIISKEALLEYAHKKDKDFFIKYEVYKDIRDRGFVIKTGFKFGFDFRVYPRGKKPGQEHTQWVINVSDQNKKFKMIELSRMVRLSGNIKTDLVQAVVDSENEVSYYEIKRLTP